MQRMKQQFLLQGLLLCSCASAICNQTSAICDQKKPISEAPNERVNYPSNFQVEGGCNLFVFGEYLYWTANESGLYFAQTGSGHATGAFPPDGSINFNGSIKRIHPDWESGVRLGAGLNFPKEGYDVSFYWTWFATEGNASASSSSGSIIPLWAEPGFATFADAFSAKGTWNMDLNVLDMEWGRSSWFGGHLSLRPFFGLRGAWIDQALKNQFVYDTAPIVTSQLHSSSNYRGAGLRAGLDTRFALPCGFAVYGLGSGSMLYGKTNAGLHIDESGSTLAATKDDFWNVVSSLQLGLGLGWDTHFAKDRLHIELHVGWEQNIWFNINQMNHFLNQLGDGNYLKKIIACQPKELSPEEDSTFSDRPSKESLTQIHMVK